MSVSSQAADALVGDDRKDEPREWRQRSRAMSLCRMRVADDLRVLLRGLRTRPSQQLVGKRAAEFVAAHRQSDVVIRRAASMELALVAAAYTASLDFEHPFEEEPPV